MKVQVHVAPTLGEVGHAALCDTVGSANPIGPGDPDPSPTAPPVGLTRAPPARVGRLLATRVFGAFG